LLIRILVFPLYSKLIEDVSARLYQRGCESNDL